MTLDEKITELHGIQNAQHQRYVPGVPRLTLTSHDLSYWNDSANRRVVPEGTFQVYLGDSSALGNLPLRGQFSLGGR